MRDRFMAPTQQPAWFSEQDLDFYTNEFERSGLAGPLSYYREITASWESLESQADQPLTPPAMCILGEFDLVRSWGLEALARAPERMPNYLGTRVLEGCGHWTQQERATETTAALITFLRALPP
jgi:pimeloyl-ACP methyl ester carboxylesterase